MQVKPRPRGLFNGNACFPSLGSRSVQGVLERDTKTVHLFERAGRTAKATDVATLKLDDPLLPTLITEEFYEQLLEDVGMLDE